MTNIIIHGILGKLFQKSFKLKISNAIEVLKAIEANRTGFLKKIKELSENNCNYCFVVDGEAIDDINKLKEKKKIKNIYLVPVLFGSGPDGGATVAIAAMLVKAGVSAATATIIAQVVVTILVAAVMAGIQALISYLTLPDPPKQGGNKMGVGGMTSAASGKARSFVFNDAENVSSQHSPVGIGYGKMRLGTNVVYASMRSYSTSSQANQEFIICSNSAGELINFFS